jgi:hypothetical protein
MEEPMNEQSNLPMTPSASGAAGWLPVWIKAVTKPNEQTFVEITESPGATTKTALLWVFIAGTVSAIVSGLLSALVGALGFQQQIAIPGLEEYQNLGGVDPGTLGVSLITTICASPLAGLLSVLFFAIGVALVQWVAKLFGGSGTFEKLAYAIAAITVPFTLVSTVLTPFSAIPILGICTGLLSFGFGIYALVLQVMAVKGVNRFGWGPATGSVFLPGCVVFLVCACLIAVLVMVLGPAMSDVFQQINQSLAP